MLTSKWRKLRLSGLFCGVIALSGCPARKPVLVSADQQAGTAEAIREFRSRALDPSGLPPMSLDPGPVEAEASGLVGTATMVRPEEVPWNLWGEALKPLLFNDRVAFLARIDLRSEEPVRWLAEGTVLEVNTPGHALPAAPTPEHVLAELNWHAVQQERMLLDGDLVQRTRYAGGFREVYLRASEEDRRLAGIVAFPRTDPDRSVGALRLTLAVEVDGEVRELVWVFQ